MPARHRTTPETQAMTPSELREHLNRPFGLEDIRWLPKSVKGNRALAIAYVSSRAVMSRLDDVFGVGGWQTSYREGEDGVVCELRCKLPGTGDWFGHEDVGNFSEQPDDGDKLKAAFSDALKRVAVHVGIGRYLYKLPHQWADYDPQKRQFVSPPKLPAWAVPQSSQPAKVATPAEDDVSDAIGDGQSERIHELMTLKEISPAGLTKAITKYKVSELRLLNQTQASDLIARFEAVKPKAPAGAA